LPVGASYFGLAGDHFFDDAFWYSYKLSSKFILNPALFLHLILKTQVTAGIP